MKKVIFSLFILSCGVFLFCGYSQADIFDWEQVNEDGFGNSEFSTSYSMADYNGKIHVGAFGYPEPGVQVWQTDSELTWNRTDEDVFNDDNNTKSISNTMTVFNGYLYAAINNPGKDSMPDVDYEGGVQVWRYDDEEWEQVNEDGFDAGDEFASSVQVFNNYLYVGTGGDGEGARIWRSDNGTTWTQVNEDGFGIADNIDVISMQVFDEMIYVGTYNYSGAQILRSSDGMTWTGVLEETDIRGVNYMEVYNSLLYVAVGNKILYTESGGDGEWFLVNSAGFGDENNLDIYSLATFNDDLYAGTYNEESGTEIWKFYGGAGWSQINSNGFGDSNNISSYSMHVFGDRLYVGVANDLTGTEVWSITSYDSVVGREKSAYTTKDESLVDRLSGRILLQTELEGEAWYVNPADEKKYYLGRPTDAFNIMRETGLGITNANLNKIPTNGTDWTINQDFKKYVLGRIVIQTEENGEAWYVSPVNEKKYYMGRPQDAFQLMRNLGLGISNTDLRKIEVGE